MKEKENQQQCILYRDLNIMNVLLHLFPLCLPVNGVFRGFRRLCATNWDKQNPSGSISLLGKLQSEKAFSKLIISLCDSPVCDFHCLFIISKVKPKHIRFPLPL